MSTPELIVTPTKTTIGDITHIPETTSTSFTPENDSEYLKDISTPDQTIVHANPIG
jgi:hypothetical protein